MQIRRHLPAALATVVLTTAAGALAASASGTPGKPGANQAVQLDRACHETVAAVQQAVRDAPSGLVQSIHSHLRVVTPGVLDGKIAFNPSGKQIALAGGAARAAAASFGCGQATAHGSRAAAGSGGSRVVSTLHRRFTKPGRYELTFTLNHAGETILAGLAASDKAYFKQHPHGQHPPTLAFGVALTYSPRG